MLKITSDPLTSDAAHVVLRLSGRVVGRWVLELRRACDSLLLPGQRLTLDLSDVSFIDGEGVALLRDLTARRVALANCSLFASEQLRQTAAVQQTE
jgi:ABC-type transporter Mla MlaB component